MQKFFQTFRDMKMYLRLFKRTALRAKKALWRMFWDANDWLYDHLKVTISELVIGVLAVATCYFMYWLSGIFA